MTDKYFRATVGPVLIPALLAIGLSGTASAQSLPDVVRTALDTHPLVGATRSTFQAAKHRIDQEKAGFLPTVSLSADGGYQRTHRRNDSSTADDLARHTQRLSVTQLLFDGGETSNRFKSAKASAEAARFGLLAAATQIGQRAVNAYLNVARDRELVQTSTDNINFHRTILADVSEAAERGGGAGSRVAQVRTRLLNARSQRRRLEANLRNSIADFVEAVGAQPGRLERPEVLESLIPNSLDEAVDIAVENSFDLQSATQRERAAARSADASKGVFLPSVNLELAHERRDNTDGTRGLEADSTALVRLSWDLYRGGRDTAARKQALEERSEARFRIHEIDRQLREDLSVALNDYEAAADQVALQQERLKTAVEVRSAYRQQFRLAQRSVLDLLDSSNEQFVAETDLINTQYEQLRAAFEIFAVSGTLLRTLEVDLPAEKGR